MVVTAMPAKRIMTVCLVALFVSVSASLCCMPLWMQADVDHSCCRHAPASATKCEPRLDVDRAEHVDFAIHLSIPPAHVVSDAPNSMDMRASQTIILFADHTVSDSPTNVLRI